MVGPGNCRTWWRLFPRRRKEDRSAEEPTELELKAIVGDTAKLKEKRKRLSSISWFMRCRAKPIARRGNHEDDVSNNARKALAGSELVLRQLTELRCF